MKIVFSRKGFDSTSGGGPSPIVDGRPVSLPIPTSGGRSRTTYGDLGLADHAAGASRGRFGAQDLCHHDPMFLPGGTCLFGQCGAAQSHLANRGVGEGDLFVFFGLFREPGAKPHHRIFGYLAIEEVVPLSQCSAERLAALRAHGHPHALAMYGVNDTIYRGPGRTAALAHDALRLSVPEGPPSLWSVPPWLVRAGLSYHDRAGRWLAGNRLRSASRGQEFVADSAGLPEARAWARAIISLVEQR